MTVPAVRAAASDETDLALARRVAAGDLGAFERIMRRHNRMLYRAARSILRDDAEAELCLQSAYLLAYRSIDTWAGHAKLSTWLARIVINEALGRKPGAFTLADLAVPSVVTGHRLRPGSDCFGTMSAQPRRIMRS